MFVKFQSVFFSNFAASSLLNLNKMNFVKELIIIHFYSFTSKWTNLENKILFLNILYFETKIERNLTRLYLFRFDFQYIF